MKLDLLSFDYKNIQSVIHYFLLYQLEEEYLIF